MPAPFSPPPPLPHPPPHHHQHNPRPLPPSAHQTSPPPELILLLLPDDQNPTHARDMPPMAKSSKMTSPGWNPAHPAATCNGNRCSSRGWAFREWGASVSHSLSRRRRSSGVTVEEAAVSLSQSTNAFSLGAPFPGGYDG